jgi:hypothetical protein
MGSHGRLAAQMVIQIIQSLFAQVCLLTQPKKFNTDKQYVLDVAVRYGQCDTADSADAY